MLNVVMLSVVAPKKCLGKSNNRNIGTLNTKNAEKQIGKSDISEVDSQKGIKRWVRLNWDLYYKTFYGCNLRISVIS